MRLALDSRASFSETARKVLLRQLEWQEQAAKEQAPFSSTPYQLSPGHLSSGQFIAAWHNLALKVTESQCHALFAKYRATQDGLLPYHVFAQQLLSAPARALSTRATGATCLARM
jgi:hypothetical protein